MKNTKKITSIMGATALGAGIVTAVIAQGCANDNSRNVNMDKTNIAAALNSLNNYSGSTTNLNTLAVDLLGVINNDINAQSLMTLTINTLQITTVSVDNISFNDNRYEIASVSITGTATSSSSSETFQITGNGNFTIEIVEEELSPVIVNGLRAENSRSRILQAMSELSSYTTESTNLSPLAQNILVVMTSAIENIDGGTFVIQGVNFTNISSFDILLANDVYTISGLEVQITAMNDSGGFAVFAGTSTLVFSESNNQTTLNSITDLQSLDTTILTIIDAVNELSSYTPATSNLSPLAQEILNLSNSTIVSIVSDASSVVINSINFEEITVFDISVNNDTFTINELSINGTVTPDVGSVLSFFGDGIVTFTDNNGTISPTSITNLGIGNQEVVNSIISGLNFFNDWSSATAVPDGISSSLLTEIVGLFSLIAAVEDITSITFTNAIDLDSLSYVASTNSAEILIGSQNMSISYTSSGTNRVIVGALSINISITTGEFLELSFVS